MRPVKLALMLFSFVAIAAVLAKVPGWYRWSLENAFSVAHEKQVAKLEAITNTLQVEEGEAAAEATRSKACEQRRIAAQSFLWNAKRWREEDERKLHRGAEEATEKAEAEAVENSLALSLQAKQHIQIALRAQGYDRHSVDGSFDWHTRSSIHAWQIANKLCATGFLTKLQVNRLIRESAADIQKFEEKKKAD